MAADRRVNPGDLVTDRFGHGAVLTQNLYKPGSRDTRLNVGEVALVTRVEVVGYGGGVYRDVCDVLFKGEVWRANAGGLRVVKDD
ncbi:hypothetical protein EBZ80_28055 [bacterium]|nr:hypothetical protein [bacterium]